MHFKILSSISDIETIAKGSGIRAIARLRKTYGAARCSNAKASLAYNCRMALSVRLSDIGMTPPASAGRNIRSKICFEKMMAKAPARQMVVCIDNEGYAVSLEKRKIYVALRDAAAEKFGLLRIIDESGEDYLYPKSSFRTIELPLSVKRAVMAA